MSFVVVPHRPWHLGLLTKAVVIHGGHGIGNDRWGLTHSRLCPWARYNELWHWFIKPEHGESGSHRRYFSGLPANLLEGKHLLVGRTSAAGHFAVPKFRLYIWMEVDVSSTGIGVGHRVTAKIF